MVDGILAIEFESMREALAAQAVFPTCRDCHRGVKYQQIAGRHLLLCTVHPATHRGIGVPVGRRARF